MIKNSFILKEDYVGDEKVIRKVIDETKLAKIAKNPNTIFDILNIVNSLRYKDTTKLSDEEIKYFKDVMEIFGKLCWYLKNQSIIEKNDENIEKNME